MTQPHPGEPATGQPRSAQPQPGRLRPDPSRFRVVSAVLSPGCLVVSCQAEVGNPLRSSDAMALMARAAEAGGAGALRVNGADDIAAIRAITALPIIGLRKLGDPAGVYITPTFESAVDLVAAGADLIATDGTLRPRPDGETLRHQITRIHGELGVPVLADVDTLEAGRAAREAGADLVATTLSGYTDSVAPTGPDVDLVRHLAADLDCPVIAEGRIRTPDDIRAVSAAGAYAVVVGTAITNPMDLTARLVDAVPPDISAPEVWRSSL